MRTQSGHAGGRRLGAASEQIRQLRPCATVGNVGDEHTGDQLQILHCQMPRTGITSGAIVQLTRIGLGISNKLFEIFSRDIRVNDEHVGYFGQQRHWREVFAHIVRLVIQHVRIHRQCAHMGQDDGVAIRRGFGHVLHRHHAGTAGLVFHKHADAQLLGQLRRDRTGHNFRGATRCKWHDEANWLGRPS